MARLPVSTQLMGVAYWLALMVELRQQVLLLAHYLPGGWTWIEWTLTKM